MRSITFPSSTLALLLLAGCQAYMPAQGALAPGTETVRLSFARPRDVVLARDRHAATSRADTIADVTAVYGRIVDLRGDTLQLVVTQLARRGALQYMPSGRGASIEMATVAGIERWSFSPQRTTVLVSIVGGVALAAAVFLAMLASAMGGAT